MLPSFSPKQGKPQCATMLTRAPSDIVQRLVDRVGQYDFDSEQFITYERSFYDTRRVVARDSRHKNKEQVYAPADFDDDLMQVTQEVRDFITTKVLPGNSHVLVQLACITPGQRLEWHIDSFLYQQYTQKIHVPIFTNAESVYAVYKDGVFLDVNMGVGEIWNINNLDMHSSINNGDTKRVHLIIDFMPTDTLAEFEATGLNYIHTPYPPAGQQMRKLYKEVHEAATAHYPARANPN